MGRYLARSFLDALATICGILIFSFLLLKALPGGPFDDEISLNPAVQSRLENSWGLRESVPVQFARYLTSAFRADFGVSLSEPSRSVGQVIGEALHTSIGLDSLALVAVLAFGFAMAVGLVLARHQWQETLINTILSGLISLPSLFLAPVLISIFAFNFDWLPAAELKSPQSYLLPILALSLRPASYFARLLAQSWSEESGQEYMKLALAKGLSFKQAMFKHALRNSAIPAVNSLGPLAIHLLSGSFLVEVLFSIPGLGTLFVRSLAHRDYPVVLGVTVGTGIFLVMMTFALDFINHKLDPRWRV